MAPWITVPLTIIYDLIIIMIYLSLLVNVGILLLTLKRIIFFLTKDKRIIKGCLLLSMSMSIVFLNDNFQMMVYYWGSPSYKLTKSKSIYYDEDYIQYFQSN